MKLGRIKHRATIIAESGLIDVERASKGRFPSDLDDLIPQLAAVMSWFESERPAVTDPRTQAELEADLSQLDAPLLRPRQIFAVGINYRGHADEVDLALPPSPMIFTKFASSLTGPGSTIVLPPGTVDWEVELVAVIGQGGRNIAPETALSHVGAYCVGQDLSERTHQMACSPAQFSMAKSHRGFAPIGPWLTTADELDNPQDLAIACDLDGEVMQSARTSMMLFDLPTQIAYLSSICELYPGDLIFTGTPAGVGLSHQPPRFIRPGEVLHSRIEKLGALRNPFVQGSAGG
ncbi:fumarylacetoacetate hydrolase family protein [Parahaliea mediterranea]|uniref:fumarylacetoacetate hydrolase family protein n=1 Tax=Parahaliea mediterranea TaxID=651086 RepID=UPI000E2FC86C|nr:fumarylacetoacetate hydrolase family protein [Parahaliea mediterranea]